MVQKSAVAKAIIGHTALKRGVAIHFSGATFG